MDRSGVDKDLLPSILFLLGLLGLISSLIIPSLSNFISNHSRSDFLRFFFIAAVLPGRKKDQLWGQCLEEGTGVPLPQVKLCLFKTGDLKVKSFEEVVSERGSDGGLHLEMERSGGETSRGTINQNSRETISQTSNQTRNQTVSLPAGISTDQTPSTKDQVDQSSSSSSTLDKPFATTYTDNNGHFAFIVPPAKYEIAVIKDGFKPKSINNLPYDVATTFLVRRAEDGFITPTIVLTPKEETIRSRGRAITIMNRLEKPLSIFSLLILSLGSVVTLSSIMENNSPDKIATLSVYLVSLALVIATILHRSSQGRVVDEVTGKALPLTLVRIFNSDGSKLIRTTITDDQGNFKANMPNGLYVIKAIKDDYEQSGETSLNMEKKNNTTTIGMKQMTR